MRARTRLIYLLLVFLLLTKSLTGNTFQFHLLANWAGLQATHGLLGKTGPDEVLLESARQTFYRALDTGYNPNAVLQRLREIESSYWYLQSQILKQQGQDWERVFTYQEWTHGQFDHTILGLWKSTDLPNWYGLGRAAERMQLWSLAAYFYQHVLEIEPARKTEAQFGLAQALLRLGRATAAEQYLSDGLPEDSPVQVQAQWLLAQSVAAQGRWSEAARLVEQVAQHAPFLLQTAEAAGIAGQIEAHVPLAISTDLRMAWEREERNLVINGNFENGYMGWGMWPEPGSNSTIDDQRVHSGLQSFRVQFDGSQDVNYYQVYQVVHVQPETDYQLSAYLWAESLTGYLGLEVRSNDWFGGNTVQVYDSTHGWQLVRRIFHTPPGVTEVSVTVRRYNGSGLVSGDVWVDDVVLQPIPDQPTDTSIR